MKTVRNQFGMKVKCCCASCAQRGFNPECKRICMLSHEKVSANGICKKWKLSSVMNRVGGSQGRVKKRVYFEFLLQSLPDKLENIRKNFNERYGSEYVNI